MKFAYVDESGDSGQSDVFVMAGLLIDAYRLRKYTAEFDQMIRDFLDKHPKAPKELKTKAFINGSGKWSDVDANDRKKFLLDVCDLAVSCSTIYAIALSFEGFQAAVKAAAEAPPFVKNYWVGAAMYLSALIQKRMQGVRNNKGLTVLIFDDNKKDMPKVSDRLYTADAWFDSIYQTQETKKGKKVWLPVKPKNRFDQIINSAFAIKSEHSSLVQVADSVSYVYRRYLELQSEMEAWAGEKAYFNGLVAKLETKRERLVRKAGGPCPDFYENARQKNWPRNRPSWRPVRTSQKSRRRSWKNRWVRRETFSSR